MIILLRIVCTVWYYVTKTSANSSAVYWSRLSRNNDTAMLLAEVIVTSYPTVQTIYTIWYNFDIVLYWFLETGTSDRRPQVSAYTPFHFSFTVPLNYVHSYMYARSVYLLNNVYPCLFGRSVYLLVYVHLYFWWPNSW